MTTVIIHYGELNKIVKHLKAMGTRPLDEIELSLKDNIELFTHILTFQVVKNKNFYAISLPTPGLMVDMKQALKADMSEAKMWDE